MEQNKNNTILFNDLKDRKGWKCGMATLPKAQSCKSSSKNNKDNKTEKE